MAWQQGMVEVTLTREQLYALVWAEPVRTVAQQLGISDVALAKTCRKHDIPVPSRGYWAKLEAGKPVTQFKLPAGDLYTRNHISVWSKPETGLAARAKALAVEYPEPTVEQLRDRLAMRLVNITTPKTFKDAHRAVRVLVERDAALQRSGRSWDRPTFASPFQQRRLRILNGIFLAMSKVGGIGRISGYEGSNIRLEVGPHSLDATLEASRGRGGPFSPTWSRAANPERLVFALATRDMHIQAPTSWRDENDVPLEDRVREIVIGIGVAAEQMRREGRRLHQEWLVRRATEEAEAARKRKVEQERLRRERLAAEAKARLDALLLDAENIGKAERLRAYVDRILANAPAEIPQDQLAAWAVYVRDQADAIDPQTSGRLLASIKGVRQAPDEPPNSDDYTPD